MPRANQERLRKKQALINQLNDEFNMWRPHFQELSIFILPRRYQWLSQTQAAGATATESTSGITINQTPTAANQRNNRILDAAATEAARTLAHGLLNGITSPARPWFRLRLTEFADEIEGHPLAFRQWLEEVTRRMLLIMAESNFYKALATQFADLVIFGTSAVIIYEDFDEVIRCYNSPVGEFRLIQDSRQTTTGFARQFNLKVHQVVERFGLENCSPDVQRLFKSGGASLLQSVSISHLIEKNTPEESLNLPNVFEYRELYWETGKAKDGMLLSLTGYREKPLIAPRWDLTGNDTYGSSPAMDALPDIKQLQTETKQKLQALDKLIRPPLVADVALQGRADALLPGGVSYVPSSSNVGAKPIYTVDPPVAELSRDIQDLILRIRRTFFNNLFRNVSDLETVRSATEVSERKAEDMVLLGPVLERFENEALDPAIMRVFNIMRRKGLLPPPPPGLDIDQLDVQYVSILADAQRAVGTASLERYMQVVGELAAAAPVVLKVPDFEELLREYGSRLNVPAKVLKSREQVAEDIAAEQEQLEAQNQALIGETLTGAAKNLSETEVGAGNNALDQLLTG